MLYNAAPLKVSGQNSRSANPKFSVVAIHDSFTSGVRAQEALEWLRHSLGYDLQIYSIAWSFQNLERLDVRAMSLRVAASADVIIISASDAEPVPDHIKRWLDASLQQQREGRAALVALHDDENGDACIPGPLCSCLEQRASRWNTEFMCNKDFDQRLDRDFAMQCIDNKRQGPFLLNQQAAHPKDTAPIIGGINE
jgi:hypothetical protein